MLETTIIICVGLLTLAFNIVPIQPVHSLEDSSTTPPPRRIRKRSYEYNPWMPSRSNSLNVYNAGHVYKPATYAISRPYYIPVYGYSGNYLFYPPQPIYVNPGVPNNNMMKPAYQAPSYLPPTSGSEKDKDKNGHNWPNSAGMGHMPLNGGGTGTSMTENRFGEDDDDGPIWPNSGGMVQMPLSGGPSKEWPVEPTRPPMALVVNTHPPLLHTPTSTNPAGSTPRPSIKTTTQRPASSRVPTGPSTCVWAIIACCSAENPNIFHQNCFEQKGCPGPFWGDSPCRNDFAIAAIASAQKYYGSNP